MSGSVSTCDVAIVGGGVVGCALARELSRLASLHIIVFEKTDMVGSGASKANSGILHAGTDTPLTTLKGRLTSRGNELIREAAKHLHFGLKMIGALVVARLPPEVEELHKEMANSAEKGIPVEFWDHDKLLLEEPNLSPALVAGMFTPLCGVLNPYELCFALMLCAMQNGAELRTNSTVVGINHTDNANYPLQLVTSDGEQVMTRFILNCAGVHTDTIAKLAGTDPDFVIVPRKGEEYLLDRNVTYGPKRVIYPVPSKVSKGILCIPTVDGTLMVGPTADVVEDPEDTCTTADGCKRVFDFVRTMCPKISERDIIASFAGVRAAVSCGDFIIGPTKVKGFINVAGIQSPGLTCAMSIAEYVKGILVTEGLHAEPRLDWQEDISPMPKFYSLPLEEQARLADVSTPKGALFSKVVCRCEVVTEGDVHAAIDQGAKTVDGVKFRTRAGCGRCQGGFCTSRILEILSQRTGIQIEELTKCGPGSTLVNGEHIAVLTVDRPFPLQPPLSASTVIPTNVDVVVIGAGPAGLAAASGARDAGASHVLVFDREASSGGILNQCIHSGFGLHHFKEELTGPEYAERWVATARAKGAQIIPSAFVLKAQNLGKKEKVINALVGGLGVVQVTAKSIVLAMGARERTRPQVRIPGTRPAGVYPAGLAQKLMNIYGKLPGKRCVILGSGDIGLIMARRMKLSGADVVGVFEVLPTCSGLNRNVVQCLFDYKIPLHLSHTVVKIYGKKRIERVTVAPVGPGPNFVPDMSKAWDIDCDSLLFSVGLIPENELTLQLGASINPSTSGAIVDSNLQTTLPGVFSCGNVLHIHDLVDNVSEEGKLAGRNAALYAAATESNEGTPTPGTKTVSLVAGDNVRYVLPQTVTIPADLPADSKLTVNVSLRVKQALSGPCIQIPEIAFQERHQIAIPSEMVILKVPLVKLSAVSSTSAISVVASGTPITSEQLANTVNPVKALDDAHKYYICLRCPNGCPLVLTPSADGNHKVTGNKCKRGIEYALSEYTAPMRTISMTIPIANAEIAKLPCKLSAAIPRDRLLEAAAVIQNLHDIQAPVHMGDVLIADFLGLPGVSVVATRSLAALEGSPNTSTDATTASATSTTPSCTTTASIPPNPSAELPANSSHSSS